MCAACGDNVSGEGRQGGATTIDDRTERAFRHQAPNLTADQRTFAQAGEFPFDQRWSSPPIGPLYNNDSCLGCHGANGRGLSQIGDELASVSHRPVSQALVRVSLASGEPVEPGGNVPVPGFGLQLQNHAISTTPEVSVTLHWQESTMLYGGGEVAAVRTPVLDIRQPNGAPLPDDVLTSYRVAPPMIGLGLLDAVDEATLLALEDPDDADGDGISGRVNHVWDPLAQTTRIGRFGWKANVATLQLQVAGAFANDMGMTSTLIPAPSGFRDLADDDLDHTVFFAATIAVPSAAPRSGETRRGRQLFDDLGCAGCHLPELVTGDHAITAVAHQTIHPYTDLLLHDMGDLLADSRPDFAASGREWRTPPLWGLGLAQVIQPTASFLHDGRARTLAEAILWHGGEAMAAREAFRTATKADRDALLAFLQTL